ncbi:hypothetical protein DIJ64_11900 [Mycobacterium leprae]|uniref:Uncharacterized protein n=2 Tax=Mycobacterium leprae TaxID=1769 RepID=A0AAD0KXQ4_MYCLR|nr:hypothetical protein [Mycobacterium leprae]AWV48506.1 hypothetical protein DIJ64_11900 [Mycobacterium leprae]OAR19985.1 hypothetical protein A8144_03240 [Mycobacterium leprae 3125609]OAX70937.1 hypothetical protein A3216_08880 [Mycobacterium leprae 7935681]
MPIPMSWIVRLLDHTGAGHGDGLHYQTGVENDEAYDDHLDFAEQITHATARDERSTKRQDVGGDRRSLCGQNKNPVLP